MVRPAGCCVSTMGAETSTCAIGCGEGVICCQERPPQLEGTSFVSSPYKRGFGKHQDKQRFHSSLQGSDGSADRFRRKTFSTETRRVGLLPAELDDMRQSSESPRSPALGDHRPSPRPRMLPRPTREHIQEQGHIEALMGCCSSSIHHHSNDKEDACKIYADRRQGSMEKEFWLDGTVLSRRDLTEKLGPEFTKRRDSTGTHQSAHEEASSPLCRNYDNDEKRNEVRQRLLKDFETAQRDMQHSRKLVPVCLCNTRDVSLNTKRYCVVYWSLPNIIRARIDPCVRWP
jgi:hypothetical protein